MSNEIENIGKHASFSSNATNTTWEDKMLPKVNPEKLIQQSRQYEFLDGLRDIQIGIFLFIFAGIQFLKLMLLREINFYWYIHPDERNVILILFIDIVSYAFPAFLTHLLTEKPIYNIRKKWLWRYSGLAKAKTTLSPTTVMIVLFITGITLGNIYKFISERQAIWHFASIKTPLLSLGLGIGLWFFGKYVNLKRYKVIGLSGILLSLFATLPNTNDFILTSIALNGHWILIFIMSGSLLLFKRIRAAKVVSHEQ